MKNNIFPVWKQVGQSTHLIAKEIAKKHDVKTSHTGTLDPMAEGVVIILLDEERHKKYEYAAWKKTYEFELVFGIETDTLDGLGLIVDTDLRCTIDETQLKKTLAKLRGAYKQKVPPYSAIKIRGKPLHWYARNNKLDEITLPTREGNIYETKLQDLTEKPVTGISNEVISDIKKTSGDLRQEDCIAGWKKFRGKHGKHSVYVANIKVTVSKGLYIRQLAKEIANTIGTVGFANKIVRTKNGRFSKDNAPPPLHNTTGY